MFGHLNKTMVRDRTSLSFSIQTYLLKSILYTNVHFLVFFSTPSFLYHNTHVNRSFVISLSSQFTRSLCSQNRLTDKTMLMLISCISKTLFTYFHRIVHEKERPTRLRGKRPKDLRTVPKALTYKTAAYEETKLSALFIFRIHFIRCGQA